jgi:aminoglycoside 3-N-acetyltransferase
MIAETNLVSMKQHLAHLGIKRGDNIVVHSSLFAFGRVSFKVEQLIELFLSVIGEHGTLIVPTYTFQLTENDLYQPDSTPSEGVGVFSEKVRQYKGAYRSYCPIHNHAGIGKLSPELLKTSPNFSFGSHSDFEFMYDSNFKLILLGSDFTKSCTYLHHVEAVVNVPYRKWLKLPRKIVKDGNEQALLCNYYARNEKIIKTDFNRLIPFLEKLVVANAPYGKSYAIDLVDLHEKAVNFLQYDPYAFIRE